MLEIKASKDVLLDGAQMFITAAFAGIAGFLKSRDMFFKDLIDYMGDMFEGSLSDLEGKGADEVMIHLLNLEILPMGIEVISSELTPDKAVVTVSAMPPRHVLEKFGTTPGQFLHDFGVTQKEYNTIYDIYRPAANAIGLNFNHYSRGDQEIITLEKVYKRT